MPAFAENRTILTDASGRTLIIPEQSSAGPITMTLLDGAGQAVPLAAIQTATLTIYARDVDGQPIINGVDRTDIKNAGRGAIHATSGLLTLELEPNDNAIVDAGGDLEWHRLLIEIGYGTTKQLKYEIDVLVRNLHKVT